MLYYENGIAQLHCGDCGEVLRTVRPRFDKIITSPPYNTRRDLHDVKYDVWKDGIGNGEYISWMLGLFCLFDELMSPDGCILWNMSYGGENPELMHLLASSIITDTPFTIADVLIWRKSTARPNNVSPNKVTRICEFVYVICRKSEYATFRTNKRCVGEMPSGQKTYENLYNIFDAPSGESIELNHSTFSTQFAEELIRRYVLPTDTVLDPFAGTGTTMDACMMHWIRSIGIELSEAQCEYAAKRLGKEKQLRLF